MKKTCSIHTIHTYSEVFFQLCNPLGYFGPTLPPSNNDNYTGWWFQIPFYFHPYLGKIPKLTNIFQMGWNHQPATGLYGFPTYNCDNPGGDWNLGGGSRSKRYPSKSLFPSQQVWCSSLSWKSFGEPTTGCEAEMVRCGQEVDKHRIRHDICLSKMKGNEIGK